MLQLVFKSTVKNYFEKWETQSTPHIKVHVNSSEGIYFRQIVLRLLETTSS